MVYDAETNTMIECECRPRMIAARRTARLSSTIPPRFRGAAWDRAPVTHLPAAMVAPLREFGDGIDTELDAGRGLWLAGPVGTGKTTLGMLVCREAVLAGRTVAIYSLPSLLHAFKDTFDTDRSMADLLDRLSVVDLLFLDDVGVEKSTAWVLEQLYVVVNSRYEQERSMVITTNMIDREALNEQVGERTVSRLSEMCEVHEIAGPDLRLVAS